MWALYPLRIAFLSGYNSQDGGSNVSANRAAETGRKGRKGRQGRKGRKGRKGRATTPANKA